MNRERVAKELLAVARELTAVGGPPALRNLSKSIRKLYKVKEDIDWMMESALAGNEKTGIKMWKKVGKTLTEAIDDIEDFSRKTIPYYASRIVAREKAKKLLAEDFNLEGEPRKVTRRKLSPKGHATLSYSIGDKTIIVISHYDNYGDAYDPNEEESEMLLKGVKSKLVSLAKDAGIQTQSVRLEHRKGEVGYVALVIKTKTVPDEDAYIDFAIDAERKLGIDDIGMMR